MLLGVRTCQRLETGSRERTIVAGLTAATLAYTVAAVGHDFTHNILDVSLAALLTGVLVSVCTMYGRGRGAQAAA